MTAGTAIRMGLAWLLLGPGSGLADNALFSRWQAEASLGVLRPLASLSDLIEPAPLLTLALATPYQGPFTAFGEISLAYFARDQATLSTYLGRLMAGMRLALPAAPWIAPSIGLGYHYLRGAKAVAGDEGDENNESEASESPEYQFIEDGESEAALSLGLGLESPWTWAYGQPFASLTLDQVLTEPHYSYLALLRLGWRY